jgi:hypothetical protein
MYKIGGITEAEMREYDEACLVNAKVKQKSIPVYNEEKNNVNLEHVSHATV